MAKKSKKSAPAPVQGESFFNEGQGSATTANAAAPTAATEAGPTVLKRKRAYKTRSKPAALKSGMTHQDAYNMGFKAGLKVAKMGA